MSDLIAVVVDPFSSGQGYAEAFRAVGIQRIYAVISHRNVFDGLWSAFRRKDFGDNIIEPLEGRDVVTADDERILALKQSGTRIVVVPGCETGVILADQVAQTLGALGNNPQTSWNRRDKWLMGHCLQTAPRPIRSILQATCKTGREALAWCRENNLEECFIKPLHSGGSDKVRRCRTLLDDLDPAVDDILIKTKRNVTGTMNEVALVQECIDGTEYVVDHVSFHGRHFTTAIFQYSKRRGPENSILYDTMRLVSPQAEQAQVLVDYIRPVLDAVGIQHGPSHAEVMIDRHGPVLIEVAARPHGGLGGPYISRACCGSNQLFQTANLLVHSDTSLLPSCYQPTQFGLELFLANPSEKVMRKRFPEQDFKDLKSCKEAQFFYQLGERIPVTLDLHSSPGRIVLIHEDLLVLHQDLQQARDISSDYLGNCDQPEN